MTMDAQARTAGDAHAPRPRRLGLVVALLVVGLAGHLLAAHMLGSRIGYIHHVAGFFLIAAITGLLLLGMERLFWRGRRDVTLLSFAMVQAIFGIVVYFLRPGVH